MHVARKKNLQTSSSLRKTKSYIYSIDFSMIINKMVNHQGWKRKHAEQVCMMYRNYLWLCKKYENQYCLPPSEEIDEFWHNHILDTEKYRRDCDVIFGGYYNHYPYFGIDATTDIKDLNNVFSDTMKLHQQEFQLPLIKVRQSRLARFLASCFSLIKSIYNLLNISHFILKKERKNAC